MKPCIRCGVMKPIEQFYKHRAMSDGHLNKCIPCCRSDAVKNRHRRLEYFRQYDRDRFQTIRRQQTVRASALKHRAAHPEKYAARVAVSNALRSGRLVRMPCEVCGCNESEAHHDDYSLPLDVRWLCRVHHLMHHGNYLTQETA